MATVKPEYNASSRRSNNADSIALGEQSPASKVEIQPLNIKKLRSEPSPNGTATDRDRDLKQKRPVLEDDTFQPPRYQDREPANQILPTPTTSSQSSTSRRPTSPSRRRSTRVSSHLHNVTASSPPRNNGETTPVNTPRSTNGAQNVHRRTNSYSRSPSFDYASYSPASVTLQSNQKSFQQEATPSTAFRRPNYPQRHSSISSASARRLLSQYTFDGPRTESPQYHYLPSDENVEDNPFLDEDGGPETSVQMGMPSLRIASNAVMKADLRSGDPYQDLSLFLDNVNGMLTSLTLSIPHLQLLCDRYRSLQDKLIEYHALAEVNRAHEEVVEQKEKQILSLKDKLNHMAGFHSAEGNRLRNKIGSLEAEIRIFNGIIVSKNGEIEVLASKLNEEKDILKGEGEHWASANGELLAAEKLELLEKHEAEIEILEEGHQANVIELEEAHLLEKARMIDSYESKIVAMQDRHRMELNDIHEKKSAELKEIHDQVASQLENDQKAKISELKDSYALELRALESKFYTKLDTLKVDVGKRKAELEKAHAAEKESQLEEFNKERALWVIEKEHLEGQIKYLQYEKNTTAFTHETEKNSLVGLVEISEQASRRLETENERLNVLLKGINFAEGEQEIIGRGDDFYIDAFTTLTKDIVDISQNFMDLPRIPPSDTIAELPSNLPNILAQTCASRILRQAYIQHIISTILCKRLFSPFLFSLADRYDNADSLLKAMSAHLRKTSIRTEAIWRNYTLMAAHTANSAKSHAALAATAIIEEIINRIRPFAEPESIDKISAAVRRVVEYAADVWRYARLEKEMFVARVESENDPSEWGCHPYETQFPYSSDSKLITSLRANIMGRRNLVLHLLPVIYREGTVPSVAQPDLILDDRRVFTPGVALFSDCLPVLHRMMELHLPGSDFTSLSISSENEAEVEGSNTRQSTRSVRLREGVPKKSREELEETDKGLVWGGPAGLQGAVHKMEQEERVGELRSLTGRTESKKMERVRTKAEKVEYKVKGEGSLKPEQMKPGQRELMGESVVQGRPKQEKMRIRMEKEEREKIEETGRKARQGETETVQIQASSEREGAGIVLVDNRESTWEDENSLVEAVQAVELEAPAIVEAELKSAADAETQLFQDKKRRRQLEEAAIELARVEVQAQREEDEAREVALREAVEAESLARVEAYIRVGEEAEAQLIAEERERSDKLKAEAGERRRVQALRLEEEAKAASFREKNLEREKITQKEDRRKALRAKIEAEVAARKLEREKQRLRLKTEAEEREKAEEQEVSRLQVLAATEAREEEFRLNSEKDREFLQEKVLTPGFVGTAKEVNTNSGVKIPPLRGGIPETTPALTEHDIESGDDSEWLVAVELDQSGRNIRGRTTTQVIEPPGRENEQSTKIGATDRDLPVDEGSMIWLRLSEPEDSSKHKHNAMTQNISREKGLMHDNESDETRSVDNHSISHSGDQGHATVGDVLNLSDKSEKSSSVYIGTNPVEDYDSNGEHENLEVDTSGYKNTAVEVCRKGNEGGLETAVAGKQDESRENIQTIYSGGKCTDQNEQERSVTDDDVEEHLDVGDESFDSTGADVGGEDGDEETDFEQDCDTSHEEEGPDEGMSRDTIIEEDGVPTELPAPPVTLEGETPGGVELAKFDFGLQAESGRNGYVDHRSQGHHWNAHHGNAESSEDESSSGRRLDKEINIERGNETNVLALSISDGQSNGDDSEMQEDFRAEHGQKHGEQRADNFGQIYSGHDHSEYGIHEERDDIQSEGYERHEMEEHHDQHGASQRSSQQLQPSDIDSKIDEDDLNDHDRVCESYQGSNFSSQLDAPVDEHYGSDFSRGDQYEAQLEEQHSRESEWNRRVGSQDGDGESLQQIHPARWSDMHIESDYDEQYEDEHESQKNSQHMHHPTEHHEHEPEVDYVLENKGNWNENDGSSACQEHQKDGDGLTSEELHEQKYEQEHGSDSSQLYHGLQEERYHIDGEQQEEQPQDEGQHDEGQHVEEHRGEKKYEIKQYYEEHEEQCDEEHHEGPGTKDQITEQENQDRSHEHSKHYQSGEQDEGCDQENDVDCQSDKVEGGHSEQQQGGEADTEKNPHVVADGPRNAISSPLPQSTPTEAHYDVTALPKIPGEGSLENEQVSELDKDQEHCGDHHESQDCQQRQEDHGSQEHQEKHDHHGHQEHQENHQEHQEHQDLPSNHS